MILGVLPQKANIVGRTSNQDNRPTWVVAYALA